MSTSRMLGLIGIWVALMVGLMVTPNPRSAKPPPAPLDAPVPLQEWTTADAGQFVSAVLPGKLPDPDPRQLRDGCKESLGQYMIKGACWQRLPVPPPCPVEDGAFAHDDGKCYVRVLKAASIPTSGDVRPLGVAEP